MLKINNKISRDSRNDPNDILLLKKLLTHTGDYNTPEFGITPYADDELFRAIKSF